MIPQSGSINIIGNSGTLTTTTVGAFSLTGYAFVAAANSRLIIVTSTPNVAFDGIRTTNGIFLSSAANASFSACTRVIAQRSPVSYNITNVAYAGTTVTLTVSALPVAPVVGQLIHIENSINSSLNGTYTLTGTPTTTSLEFTLGTNPNTGFANGVVFPGIVNSVAGTGNGCVGYYTINRPALADVGTPPSTPGTLVANSTARNPFVVTTGTTHVIASSGTATFANIFIDAVGSVAIPCGQPLALRNLKGGACFMATGTTSGTDVLSLSYVTYNPLGNP